MSSGAKTDGFLVRFWVPNEDALETGVMIYPDERLAPDAVNPLYVLTGAGKVLTIAQHTTNLRYTIGDSHAIPLRGSAIKDVQQTNIYQGDIVQIAGTPTLIEVVFVAGMFGLLMQHDERPLCQTLMTFAPHPGVRILGNIYENPEVPTLFRLGYHEV